MKDSTWPLEVAFVGPSGSGKTTLIERLVHVLSQSGTSVAVVKHTHHHIDWDQPGKDSWRFREAGASAVVLSTPERLLLQKRRTGPQYELDGSLLDAGLVIHEGDRQSALDKLLVGESVAESLAKGTRGRIVAVIGRSPEPGVLGFDRDDPEDIARFLVGLQNGSHSRPGFDELLARAVEAHGHLCPGQVLGVRMTMRGLSELGLEIPPPAKRLMAIVETDRCAADAVASVSGCSLGRRTLKHYDFGKMAASFLDLSTGRAVRVVARDDSRDLVPDYAAGVDDRHDAQTAAYRLMPDSELLTVQKIGLHLTEADMPGRPRSRVACSVCGEHISDDRQVTLSGQAYCRSCAGTPYYTELE